MKIKAKTKKIIDGIKAHTSLDKVEGFLGKA